MLRPGDLVDFDDFSLGALTISPSRRIVVRGERSLTVEPRVMQVVVLLARHVGKVVTRQSLFDEIWPGVAVGDDSLNRAIAGARRAFELDPDGLELETIPRTGYRLHTRQNDVSSTRAVSRRAIVLGGSAATLAVASALWTLSSGHNRRNEVSELIARGRQVLREAVPNTEQQAIDPLRRAVEIEPGNAEAWGYLALAYQARVQNGANSVVTAAFEDGEQAARKTLSIDPANGNALTALATFQPEFGNWWPVERQLRNALDRDPDCVAALNSLTLILQSVGRAHESFRFNERAAAIDPFDVTPQFRLAIKSWIFGRIDEADRVIERGLQLWPHHPALWNTRLMILAYSGRAAEGSRYLERSLRDIPSLTNLAQLWKVTLAARQTTDAHIRGEARTVLRERASRSSVAAIHGIMALSALGFVDDAFDVANGYFRWRGKLAGAEKSAPKETLLNDQSWRRTMMLFTPATSAMRQDQRFRELVRGIGLEDYWRASHSRPDQFLLD